MVSYDSYKNRIIKIAAVKNFIVKFRALFITLIALILAATTVLLILKGMVTGELTLPEQIVYGDSFDVGGANAIMSSVEYEYCLIGIEGEASARIKTAKDEISSDGSENWTSVKPYRAGRYLVRTVTKKSFGITGYGTPVEFEIQPKDIDFTITGVSVVYGDVPVYSFPLINGDVLEATGLEFDFESFEVTVTNVCANASSIRVIAPDGSDVTYCYNIATPSSEITFIEREITLAPQSAEYIYDGEGITYESVIDGKTQQLLSAGDSAVIQTVILDKDGNEVDEPTLAGTYTVKVTDYKIYKGETDVTARYGVSALDCEIVIARRPINVSTASEEMEFNGEQLINRTFEVEGLPEIHTAVNDGEDIAIINAGSVLNTYNINIFDCDGNDVSENYIINYNYGTLKVNPRNITITTASGEKQYDGTELTQTQGYKITRESGEGLISGHSESISYITGITDVSQSGTQNTLKFAIYDTDGNNVTANYNITYEYGTLNITPRPLTITTGSLEKEYDGFALYGNETADITQIVGLAEGQTAYISQDVSITDAGNRDNDLAYEIYSENKITTANYDITYIYGTLTVTPRRIIIITRDGFYEYDGAEHTYAVFSSRHADYDGLGLVSNMHIINAEECASIVDVGITENVCKVADIHEASSGIDVTENYEIVAYEYGTISIYKRNVTVFTQSYFEDEYDGTAKTYTQATADNLAPDQFIAVDESRSEEFTSVTNVEEQAVLNYVYYIIVNEEGVDVSENYNIEYFWGEVNRSPRIITVTTASAEKIYDGKPLQKLDGFEASWLYEAHELVLDESRSDEFASVTDAQYSPISNQLYFKVAAVDGGEEDNLVADRNYYIDYEASVYGTLTITERQIKVITASIKNVYDGYELLGSSAAPEINNLVEGEKYYVSSTVGIINVGSITNQTRYSFYRNDNIEEITNSNYVVIYEYGTLEITPRPLTITTGTDSKIYDGTPLYGDSESLKPVTEGLAYNQYLTAIDITGITEVGSIPNTTQYLVYSGETETTGNYDITYNYGTLIVTARGVTIITSSPSKEYDGEPLKGNTKYIIADDPEFNLFVSDTTYILNLPANHDVETYEIAEITNVGIVDNLTKYNLLNADGEDVTSNFEITYVNGTLTVYQRELNVTTGSANHVYDRQPFSYTQDITADRLVLNHGVVPDSSQGEFASVTYVSEGEVENKVYVKVLDGDGNDVSANYAIAYSWGNISVTPRPITIHTGSATKEYDGETLYGSSVEPEIDNLVEDETYKVDSRTVTMITNAQSTPNITHYLIYFGDKETTDNYAITYDYGTLEITPRKITVTTATKTHVYDGQPFSYTDDLTVTRLLENYEHSIALDESRRDEFASVTYVSEGEVENKVYVIVKEISGFDISYNYDITYVWGKISITPRPLTITTGSAEKEYDGTPLKGDSVLPYMDNLVDDESFISDEITEITDVEMIDGAVGSVVNKTTYKIYSGSKETTDNYDITYKFDGKLKITPRPITIQTIDKEWVYDGKEHSPDGVNVIYTRADGSTEYGFVSESHSFTYGQSTAIRDVGSKQNYCFINKIFEELYSTETQIFYRDISDNYTIVEYIFGTLTVTPRPITITTGTKLDTEYDGLPFTYAEGESADNLAPNQSLKVDESRREEFTSVTEVSDVNSPNYIYYIIVDADGKDVSSNYDIKYVWGEVNRSPREITVTTDSADKVYDGTALYCTDGYTYQRLLDGEPYYHTLALDESISYATVTYVTQGEVENKAYYIVKDAEGKDISYNYDINYVWGKLSITKRDIDITTADGTKTYDGTPLYGNEHAPEVTNIVEGEYLSADAVAEITNAGSIDNTTSYKIYSGSTETTGNYNIKYVYGTLEVEVCKLTITTGTKLDKEYDATPFYYTEVAYPTVEGLAEGDRLQVDTTKLPTFVTEVLESAIDNEVYYNVYNAQNELVNDNYDIKYIWGKLNRTPREIAVTTGSERHEYDGQPFSYTDGITADRIISSHVLKAVENEGIPSLTDVGTAENILVCKVYNSRNEDISHNYTITGYTYGEIEVYKRDIVITTADDTKTYDGTALGNNDATADKLVEGHRLVVVESSLVTIVNVGNIENKYTYKIYDGERDVTSNYNIGYNYGTLEVTPCEISVTLQNLPDIIYGDTFVGYPAGAGNYLSLNGSMADGEQLEIAVKYLDGSGNAVTPKDAGTYIVVIDIAGSKVHYRSGNTTATGNYTITQDNISESKFAISKRDIVVQLIKPSGETSDGKVYDGQKFEYPVSWYKLVDGTSMAYGEVLCVGVSYYGALGAPVTEIKDAADYSVVFNRDKCTLSDGTGATKNYNVSSDGNNFGYTVTQKSFTVTLDNVTWEYDGTVYKYPSEKVVVNGLLEGVTLGYALIYKNGENTVSPVYAGRYTVEFDEQNWTLTGDKKSNYKLNTVDNVVLTIDKREISVKVWFAYTDTGDNTKIKIEYSGEVTGVDERSYISEKSSSDTVISGFVNGDDLTVVPAYTYTQNGVAVQPVNKGVYVVSISFAGNSLIDNNYKITYSTGTLEISNRKVTVGTNNIGFLSYDGTALDFSLFDYYQYHKDYPTETGFLNGENYEAKYSVKKSDGTAYSEGDILYAGYYTVSVTLQNVDVSLYDVYYEDMNFTVLPRNIGAVADSASMDYSKTKFDYSKLEFNEQSVYYIGEGNSVTQGAGFVNDDFKYAEVRYLFVGEDGNEYQTSDSPVNAGTYLIYVCGIVSNDGSGFVEQNYSFVESREVAGVLVISPITLIIAPVNQSKLYDGTSLELSYDGYTILEGQLMSGDMLSVEGNAVLQPTVARATVEIANYYIYDTTGDMRSNYRVLYTYDASLDEMSGYRASTFRAALSYTKRTVVVSQVVPEYLKGVELVYDGSIYSIEYSGTGSELFIYYAYNEQSEYTGDSAAYGLVGGQFLSVISATLSNKPDVNTKWLKLTVSDSYGNSYAWAYNIIVIEKEETNITVSSIGVTVTVNVDIEGMDDCILTEDQFSYELTRGGLLERNFIQVSVAGGELVVGVYELLDAESGRVRDRTAYYAINVVNEGSSL